MVAPFARHLTNFLITGNLAGMKPFASETVSVLNHLTEILLAFTDLDGLDEATKEELNDEAFLKASLIWESMGGQIVGADAGALQATLHLEDVEKFLTKKASEVYVEGEE